MLDAMTEQRQMDQERAEQMMQQQQQQSELLQQVMAKLDSVTHTLKLQQQQVAPVMMSQPNNACNQGQASELPPLFLPMFSPPAPRLKNNKSFDLDALSSTPKNTNPSIEDAWKMLLTAYKSTDASKRAQQLSLVARSASQQDRDCFQEMAVLASLESNTDKNAMLDFGLEGTLVPMDLDLELQGQAKDFYAALMH